MQEKIQQSATNINVAFQDLKMLMEMAKDMVRLANVMSSKIKVSFEKCFNSFQFYFGCIDVYFIEETLKAISCILQLLVTSNEKD